MSTLKKIGIALLVMAVIGSLLPKDEADENTTAKILFDVKPMMLHNQYIPTDKTEIYDGKYPCKNSKCMKYISDSLEFFVKNDKVIRFQINNTKDFSIENFGLKGLTPDVSTDVVQRWNDYDNTGWQVNLYYDYALIFIPSENN